ncbi:MAG: prepilin-type N-terminal cleavage/methylation domain-containing protein [Candidatus Binatia bacterium]
MRFPVPNFEFRISKFEIQNGFTLLEVVVAMAIVGLGVVTLLEIFSLGLRLGANSSERTEAVSYARQVMDEVLIRGGVGEGKEKGSFGERYRWILQVAPFQEESELLLSTGWGLKEVTLQMGSRYGDVWQVRMKTLRLVREGAGES